MKNDKMQMLPKTDDAVEPQKIRFYKFLQIFLQILPSILSVLGRICILKSF